ncbi:sphingosine-1-phosphate lyase 1-like [Paramuricea clavata]|nr:sphingosine-1-phosphate lyase 1-like [Paramuricea clavata]
MHINDYQKLGKISWEMGSGVVYHGGKDLTEIQTQVFSKFLWSNPLHPEVFPGVRKMEAEVIQMCVQLFNGEDDSCGTMTASGTNSLLMACKTYRDWGRDVKGITKPEIVVAVSAHAAFEKAADYFQMKIVKIPVNEKKRSVNIKAMRKGITRNTVMLVGSAPEFPSGIIDNIEEIAKLGKRYNIGVHVDACLGGFVLAFMKAAGFNVPAYDFSVDGVTSISADAHKYGCAPKGSSVILYHSHSLRHYQYHTSTEWTGGIYATPTISGSRPGVLIAQCWASMMHLGKSGYIEATKRIVKTTRSIRDGLRQSKGVFVFGDPEVCVVAFGSKEFDIFALGDELAARDWKLNALQFPSSLHICVTLPMAKSGVAEKFLRDVRECSNKILRSPNWQTTGVGAIYGMAQKIPDRSMVRELANHHLDCMYSTKIHSSENGI